MSFNLDDVVNKIQGYRDVLRRHGFELVSGGGVKPFSQHYKHADGRSIDVRNSEWTVYDMPKGTEPKVGDTYTDLDAYLKG